MTIIRVSAAVLLAGLILMPFSGYSEVGQRPDTPDTGAYVSEINTDWVQLSINTGYLSTDDLAGVEERIYASPEIWDLAEFACNLYDRTSVLLSQSYESAGHIVSRIDYLFACALP